MNIAFLTPEYPSLKTGSSGGIGTSIFNLANSLILNGLSVTIFVYCQDEDEYYQDSGIHLYRIKNLKFKGLSWWLTRKKIEKVVNNVIKDFGIDLIEVPDWTGISAWINFNCKVVMRLNGSDTYFCHLDKRPIKWWNKFQEKAAYRQADAIIAVSDYVGHWTNMLFNFKRKYTVIPNCIDTFKFDYCDFLGDSKLILYFGTLIRKKGVLEIPHIFNLIVEKYPNAKLILVGGDAIDIHTGNSSTWNLMEPHFSINAKSCVEYIGKKQYSDIKQYIANASVCIFPSFAEALPVSWLEAMSMGKAIVASNIGWASELIEDGKDGFLVCPDDHKAFSEKILILLENRILRRTMGIKARIKVEAFFSNNIISKKTKNYYKTLTYSK